MNFKRAVEGLKSRRVTDVEQPEREPTMFEVVGGFAPVEDALPDDPALAERSARVAGMEAQAQLERERAADRAEAVNRQLQGVQRGYDYSRGLGGLDR